MTHTSSVSRSTPPTTAPAPNQHPELDEFIARNVDIHFEVMDTCQWWIGITAPDGRQWAINCGAVNPRARGYAIVEEET